MIKSLFLGSVFGGLILFVWTFVSWAILPFHDASLKRLADPAAVIGVLRQNTVESGIYAYPMPPELSPTATSEQRKAAEEQTRKMQEQGPLVFLAYHQAGSESMQVLIVRGLALQIVNAFLATVLLLRLRGQGYFGRLGTLLIVALIVGIAGHMPQWNWWHFSTHYTVLEFVDLLVSWFFAGLLIAGVTGKSSRRM
jgi:hypothetical protein